MADDLTLLGFAAAASAAKLQAILGAVPGPRIRVVKSGALAAFAQDGAPPASGVTAATMPASAANPGVRRPDAKAAFRALACVQLRLEAACGHGAFLPADPGHASCDAAELAGMLAASSARIGAALLASGLHHQWDVVLRWDGQAAVASRRAAIATRVAEAGGGRDALAGAVKTELTALRAARAAALQDALGPVVLALIPAGASETETGVTVLLQAGAGAVLETALATIPAALTDGVSADLRGPLPPLSFAAVRIDRTAPQAVDAAWQALGLPAQADDATLRQHWRRTAARLHPDHGASDPAPMTAAGAAFRLLRSLLPSGAPARSLPHARILAHGRLRVQGDGAAS